MRIHWRFNQVIAVNKNYVNQQLNPSKAKYITLTESEKQFPTGKTYLM